MRSIFLFIVLCITVSIKSQISDFKNINFNKADNIAKIFEGESLHNLPLLTYNLTSKLNTDIEKFRAIYTWICTNIKGDYTMHRKVSRKRNQFKNDVISFLKWNDKYTKTVFKNLLKNKKTMCTGYAYLLKTMANIANMECEIINGYGKNTTANIEGLKSPNHSWNAVKINNKWYLADATWSSGYINQRSLFVKDYNDGYFITEPILFAKNHFPLEKKWLLITNYTLSIDNFINAPLVYGDVFKNGIIAISPTKIKNEIYINKEVKMSYNLIKMLPINKIQLLIVKDSQSKIIRPKIELKKNRLLLKHTFKKKGIYDVHLLLNSKVQISYSYIVKD